MVVDEVSVQNVLHTCYLKSFARVWALELNAMVNICIKSSLTNWFSDYLLGHGGYGGYGGHGGITFICCYF